MESPYLSPNPITSTLSSSDCSSDYLADISHFTKNAPNSTERKSTKKSISSFIQKLYNMLEDNAHGHLISWNPSGTSFSVCNAKVFASQVLPAHFKHSNFSSFVRLLNMYGFHKISKSSRSQRSTDMEVWEFSHPNLIRGRPDLLKNIKRKAMDSETIRREKDDIHASFSVLQTSQNELLQQFHALQENITHLHHALEESKKTQQYQSMQIDQLLEQRGIPKDNNIRNTRYNSQPSPPLTHHRLSLSAQNDLYTSYQPQRQPQLDEPFQMMVTTPPRSEGNSHSYVSQAIENNTTPGYWINNSNNSMSHMSISQPSPSDYHDGNTNDPKGQQQQQQQQNLYSPMTLQAAVNTPLPPSPGMLTSTEVEISPGSSVDSRGSYSFGFIHPNTLGPTMI